MNKPTIDKATVDVAVAAARDDLANKAGLAWIKKSSLLERAYNLGLYCGLSAIADEDLLRGFALDTMLKTMHPREADDTFISTTVGRDYYALMKEIAEDASTSCDVKTIAEKLKISIEDQDRHWQHLVRQSRKLLSEIASVGTDLETEPNPGEDTRRATRRSELHRLVDDLEVFVRRIALLETDHRIQKRLEE